jgi:hypothetical protein
MHQGTLLARLTVQPGVVSEATTFTIEPVRESGKPYRRVNVTAQPTRTWPANPSNFTLEISYEGCQGFAPNSPWMVRIIDDDLGDAIQATVDAANRRLYVHLQHLSGYVIAM